MKYEDIKKYVNELKKIEKTKYLRKSSKGRNS